MKTIVLLIVFSLKIFPSIILAGNPPSLLSPVNNSQVSSSKIIWQNPAYPLYPNNPFNIEIDNNADFSSPEKDYTTENTSYTPQLNPDTWNWRVRAKDSGGIWSSWSEIWQFNLVKSTPSPAASPTSTEGTSPSPSPISTKFLISSMPSEISSSESYSAEISLVLPNNQNSIFYIKGAFTKEGSSNYFGQTLVSDNWIKNNKTYSEQLKINTDISGKWAGTLQIKVDPTDSGFDGSGDYIFKAARYSQSGSGPTWSNELMVKIIKTEIQTPTPTKLVQPSTKVTSNNSSEYKLISTPSSKSKIVLLNSHVSSVSGVSTNSPNQTLVDAEKKSNMINWWLIIGGLILLITGLGFVVKFFKLRRNNADN